MTYSFSERGSIYSTSNTDGYGPTNGGQEPWGSSFSALSSSDRPFFTQVLAGWSAIANLNFVQVADNALNVGDIRAAYTYQRDQDAFTAWAYYPNGGAVGGDIWFNAFKSAGTDVWRPGSFAYFSVMHEMGHALGLKHPFEAATVPTGWDTISYTVMSYSALLGNYLSSFDYYPTTPMMLDILAMQQAYGGRAANTDNTAYIFNDSSTYHQTIYDTAGSDTIRYDGFRGASIDLNEHQGSVIGTPVNAFPASGGSTQVKNVWIANGVVIENAIGGSAADTLTGNASNNVLTGRGGNDLLDGGAGIDTAAYSGLRNAYTITKTSTGYTVSGGGEGIDGLANIERLIFADAKVAIDTAGSGGMAYRLYQAAFNRTPDAAGLGYQIGVLDGGLGLTQVASNFIASSEFTRTYGNLSNTGFVTQLYQNVLHRSPDSSGLAFHTGNLASAANTRANVLVGFSESPENQAALIGVTSGGMVYS